MSETCEPPPGDPTAIICLTGSELTRGETHDRNGPYLATALTRLGIRVEEIRILPDSLEKLEESLKESMGKADLVLISGGLGPTADDRTTEALARVLGRGVHQDPAARERMHRIALRRLGSSERIPANFYKQAEVVDGSRVLHNPVGLAPGSLLETGRGQVITLPGVPRELQAMFREVVVPKILERFRPASPRILRGKIVGVPESVAEARIQNLDIDSGRVEYGISARPGEITVRFLSHRLETHGDLDEISRRLEDEFGDRFFALPEGIGESGESELSRIVHQLLIERGVTVATAESCTGGLIGKRLTDHAGSSACFLGSVVAYHDSIKERLLGVDARLLREHGAVSAEVYRAMAVAVRERFAADYGIAVTGIAGPGGGSAEKPVGLVYTGLARSVERTPGDPTEQVLENRFQGGRDLIRAQAVTRSLDMLRRDLVRT